MHQGVVDTSTEDLLVAVTNMSVKGSVCGGKVGHVQTQDGQGVVVVVSNGVVVGGAVVVVVVVVVSVVVSPSGSSVVVGTKISNVNFHIRNWRFLGAELLYESLCL